ncbi:CD82 antigen-like isoform X2 [Mercenaria mercenaria]|nr:CD82 antigen-like isoform X2 [Mercenaria mercenaria]
MGLRGIGSFIKYSMFLFNAIILVAGCALVGFGIYTKTSSAGVTKFSSILGSNLLPTISLVLIITGAVIILLSFLGCCGAIKEVKCMLLMFFFLLLLIFLAFLVGGILLYAFQDKIEDTTLNQLRHQLLESYGTDGEESVTEAWDSMQKLFKCCGVSGDVNSSDSWAIYKLASAWFAGQSVMTAQQTEYVPVSCCKDPENTPNVTKCQGVVDKRSIPVIGPPVIDKNQLNDQLYTEGCYTSLRNMITGNLNVLIGVGVGIAVAMILGMVFSICLCRKIKNDDDYYDECD